MMYRTIMLTIAALSTTQASAGDLGPPVYVAPGGVYIGTAQVFVAPPSKHIEPYAAPSYDPGFAPTGYYGYRHRGYYHGVGPAYGVPPYGPAYGAPPYGPVYAPSPYAVDYAPRPPVGVPFRSRCYIDPTYGPGYC
jgi:hypothetical protein